MIFLSYLEFVAFDSICVLQIWFKLYNHPCLRCRDVAMSRCRDVALSRCRVVALSRCRVAAMSRCRDVALSRCRAVMMSRCRDVALWERDIATLRHRDTATTRHYDGWFVPSRVVAMSQCRVVRTRHRDMMAQISHHIRQYKNATLQWICATFNLNTCKRWYQFPFKRHKHCKRWLNVAN